jgi:hypothetical protein
MKNKRDTDSNLVLSQYCKLHIQSPDSVWKSRAINAVICPGLHTDLILGLEFLVNNKIVVDAELRTAIAKETGYDLLNPPDPKLCQKKIRISPFEKRKQEARAIRRGQSEARKTQKLVHEELRALFEENPACFEFEKYTTGPPDVVASIKARIKQLAGEADLQKLDKAFKQRFADQFPSDIPHVKDLPRNVYHNIELKLGAPVSVARSYSCPVNTDRVGKPSLNSIWQQVE